VCPFLLAAVLGLEIHISLVWGIACCCLCCTPVGSFVARVCGALCEEKWDRVGNEFVKRERTRPLFGPYPICPCGEHGHVCVMWSLVCLVRVSVFNHTHFRFSYGFHLSSLPPSFVRFGCFLRGPVPVTPSLVRLLPMHFLSRTHDMSVRAPPSDNPSVRAHFFFFFVFLSKHFDFE